RPESCRARVLPLHLGYELPAARPRHRPGAADGEHAGVDRSGGANAPGRLQPATGAGARPGDARREPRSLWQGRAPAGRARADVLLVQRAATVDLRDGGAPGAARGNAIAPWS